MPFCTSCGAQGSGKFCTKCGSPFQAGKTSMSSPSQLRKSVADTVTCTCGNIVTSQFCTGCGKKKNELVGSSNIARTSTPGKSSAPAFQVKLKSPNATPTRTFKSPTPSSRVSNQINSSSSASNSVNTSSVSSSNSDSPFKISLRKSAAVSETKSSFSPKPVEELPFRQVQLKKRPPPTSKESKTCKKCGAVVATKFCTQCGHNNEAGVFIASKGFYSPSKAVEEKKPTSKASSSRPVSAKPPVPTAAKPPVPSSTKPPVPMAAKPPVPSSRSSVTSPKPPVPTAAKPPTPEQRKSMAKISSPNLSCSKCGASRETRFCTQCGHDNESSTSSSNNISTPTLGTYAQLEEENVMLRKQLEALKKQRTQPIKPEQATPSQPPPRPQSTASPEQKEKKSSLRDKLSFKKSTPVPTSEPLSPSEEVSLPADPEPAGPSPRRSWKQKYDTYKKRGNTVSELQLSEPKGRDTKSFTYTDPSLDPQTKVIREIVETEEDYIKDLNVIIKTFMKPLLDDSICSKEEIVAIFSNVELILGVNQTLLDLLKENQTASGIGDSFLKMADYLKMYATFCSNQGSSLDTIMKMKEKKDKKFDTFLAYCLHKPECQGLDLNSFLIKPIQRVCKYPLLLRELIKNTNSNSEDFSVLNSAAAKIEDIVNDINEKKRHSENSQKIVQLQKNLIGGESIGLVTPTRRYLKEGELEYYESGKFKPGYYFLFNDLFMHIKKKGSKMYLKAYFTLDKAILRPNLSTYGKPAFELLHPDIPPPGYWCAAAATEEMTNELMMEIQENADRVQSSENDSRRNSRFEAPVPSDIVRFSCQYYDQRILELPASEANFENLKSQILSTFDVPDITIMHQGADDNQYFISNDQELEYLIGSGLNQFKLLLYDAYSEDSYY